MNKIKDIKFAFFGTPDLVIPILDELEKNNLLPSLIVTGKDVEKGRKLIITSPSPKIWAEKRDISVLQPEKIDNDFIENFKKNNFDLAVVVAYGKILPLELINTPKYGMVNVHYSLLPKYRGATPVESAILAGDKETGVSIQQMIFNLDAGDIIDEERTNINENEGTQELRSRLNEMAKILLPKTIQKIVEGSATFKKQNNLDATYSKKIKKEDARIDFEDDPYKNFLKIRAYNVWPVAFFFKEHLGKKIRVKITDVSFSDGKLIIKKVIPEGKKEMDYESFVRGYN